jgi:hypothetical protein
MLDKCHPASQMELSCCAGNYGHRVRETADKFELILVHSLWKDVVQEYVVSIPSLPSCLYNVDDTLGVSSLRPLCLD